LSVAAKDKKEMAFSAEFMLWASFGFCNKLRPKSCTLFSCKISCFKPQNKLTGLFLSAFEIQSVPISNF